MRYTVGAMVIGAILGVATGFLIVGCIGSLSVKTKPVVADTHEHRTMEDGYWTTPADAENVAHGYARHGEPTYSVVRMGEFTQCRVDEQTSSAFGGGLHSDSKLTAYCNQMLADGWKPISAGVQFVWVK